MRHCLQDCAHALKVQVTGFKGNRVKLSQCFPTVNDSENSAWPSKNKKHVEIQWLVMGYLLNVFNHSNATVAIPMLSTPLQMRCLTQRSWEALPGESISALSRHWPCLCSTTSTLSEMDAYYGDNLIDICIYIYVYIIRYAY